MPGSVSAVIKQNHNKLQSHPTGAGADSYQGFYSCN